MSAEYYYNHCQKHLNRPVEITTHDGLIHRGIVHSVNPTHVYLRPFDGNTGGAQGPGLFYWGFGGAFAGGFLGGLTGVALGNIATFRPYGFGFI